MSLECLSLATCVVFVQLYCKIKISLVFLCNDRSGSIPHHQGNVRDTEGREKQFRNPHSKSTRSHRNLEMSTRMYGSRYLHLSRHSRQSFRRMCLGRLVCCLYWECLRESGPREINKINKLPSTLIWSWDRKEIIRRHVENGDDERSLASWT